MNEKAMLEFLDLASNGSYGDCEQVIRKESNGKYKIIIKSCSHQLVVDLLKNDFSVFPCRDGMHVEKF